MRPFSLAAIPCFVLASGPAPGQDSPAVRLPAGVEAVWDLEKAFRETTPTRERVCINGLWRWQPAEPPSDQVPSENWGYFKVPGPWPGITDYMQKDCQTVWAHPSWQDRNLRDLTAAWYQREITLPEAWAGRRIILIAEYLNSYAVVFVDGQKVGEMRFPRGEVDLTSVCRPGGPYRLSLLVWALPLQGVMLSYSDTASAREVRGTVARRGLCGDVFLESLPPGPRLTDVKVDPSTRRGEITLDVALQGLGEGPYTLQARITDQGKTVKEFTSPAFQAADLRAGRFVFTEPWKAEKWWDLHTPQNQYELQVSLQEAGARSASPDAPSLDTFYPVRFGFREFWIEGRDFYLNGSRIFLCAVPLDNAQVGAALATYEAARESLERLRSFGINFVYTHNYGCEPGSHLSFTEILRAADDVGMLVSLSQPHFGHYSWESSDADQTNGYAGHAEFYVRVAQNHPSVVMYAMSHNATGYSEDMNPDRIDGLYSERDPWSWNNVQKARRAEAIVKRLDPSRIIYHHSSGNLSSMHTSNFYPNFVPIQEMSDWFEHWATVGVKPLFTCEYGAPLTWDWAMYRGWYKGRRAFGSARVPWDFCLAEWNAQFFGDRAFQISEEEKTNLRWEARQFREGNLWYRWDYPHQLGSSDFDERYPVLAQYLTDNWRAFRTWGVSAISPWEHDVFWKMRPDLDRNRRVELPTDWQHLQRPGFSPDYLEERYERMDLAYERTDWVPTLAAQAMYRNNRPLLAYIGGPPAHFTCKDHHFLPGEAVEKQIIVINNSRRPVTCEVNWALALPRAATGAEQVHVETGQQARIPLRIPLPGDLPPGEYALTMAARFSSGETQEDEFAIHVLPPPPELRVTAPIALFDPRGETARLLDELGVRYQSVEADADLTGFEVLILGKAALTVDGPAPDVARVRDGLKVLAFEQTAAALEKRLGFRVQEYGLRQVFPRVAGHPALAGLEPVHLRDWRGEATILPPRLDYVLSDRYSGAPVVRWCGLEVPRLWRCGNRGNVASVLIEKPARGDFLPLVDGGFSLQYSPLMEYREGQGLVLFCQMDVTGRTESDPAAARLVRNLLNYISSWTPAPSRQALYVGEAAGRHYLESAGVSPGTYAGGPLSPDQVLVVGRGGGQVLAEHAPAVARWLKAGGHLLALELEAQEANAFLPFQVRTVQQEHIATYFEPLDRGSLLAGVGPADVHNRDPRQLPLLAGGAKVVGNGVLAQAENANVVFCQLVPYTVSAGQGRLPSLAVSEDEAVEGRQSALLDLGTVPWGQFGQAVPGGEVGRTYTFAVFVKALGRPVRVRLEVERAASPWDRAVRGEEVLCGPEEWTELHVTFNVEKPFPEGWQAYIHCAQEGGRFRADWFRLYQGDYLPGRSEAAAGIPNLFTNPSFEAGTEPWFFNWNTEQHNLRKTYRRTAFLLNRLLANLGVRGETPLLSRFSTPVREAAESVLRNGDFRLDADGDGVADHWQFSAGSDRASGVRERIAAGEDRWCQRLTCPEGSEGKAESVMLAQYDVPVKKGQWYRISLQARAEGLQGARVNLTVMNTTDWRSFFEYQRFAPDEEWKPFTFLVESQGTADSQTRFQIWFDRSGTLWLSDLRMEPCQPPTQGRWREGLYLDTPEEWDDPYRFFRW
jgi:beta-galactosidase